MVKEPEEIKQMCKNLKDLQEIYKRLCWMEDPTREISSFVYTYLLPGQDKIKEALEQQAAELQTARDRFWDSVYNKEQADANAK